jgi:hypothetical protein
MMVKRNRLQKTDDPAVSLSNMETVGNQLEQQILEAEKETENLTRELAELDEIWNKNMALFEDNPAVKSAAAKQAKTARQTRKTPNDSTCTRQVKGEGEDHASGKGRYRQVFDWQAGRAQVCCRQEPRQECRQQGCGSRAIGYVWRYNRQAGKQRTLTTLFRSPTASGRCRETLASKS